MNERLTCRRDEFDIPADVTYLNCAYMGPLSRRVVAAGREGLEKKTHPWTIGVGDFFEPVEDTRRLFAELLNADADGVALLPSVSYGIAVAAQNLRLPRGGRVLTLADEFPSNVYAWRELAAFHEGEVATVPRPENADWTSAILDRIDERSAIVAVPNCHWTDGGSVDLVRIGQRTREVGAALIVDGTQSIGAVPFDVAEVKPNFLVTAVYKWLLGPYSTALLWCAPEHRSGRPLEYSWIARRNSDDFAGLIAYEGEYRVGARRYDVGETSNFALVPAVNAALRQTLDWDVSRIARYTSALNERLAEGATALGLGVAPSHLRADNLIGIRLHNADPEVVTKAMGEAKVFVSVRGDAMRVSPHVYNDETDVDRLLDVLRTIL